jgi:hypothetical protein
MANLTEDRDRGKRPGIEWIVVLALVLFYAALVFG